MIGASRGRTVLLALLVLGVLGGSASAQLPLIRLDSVFPLGGQAGTETMLEIVGRDLDGAAALHFDHPGLTATRLKERQFRVRIAADVPPGTYEVRAVGTYGISGARLFAVNRGLAEVAEREPNDSPAKAQPVPLNCVVNGRSDGNGDDFFRLHATKGTRLVIDCRAFRLDSRMRGILSLATADGKDLLQSRPYHHLTDPLLDFVAPAEGDYVVRLHDMTFTGGLPYRLVISTRPHVENAFPMAADPGARTERTLLGRNLPGGRPAPAWTVQEQPLDERRIALVAPNAPALRERFTFVEHPLSPALTLRGVQVWPTDVKGSLNPVTLAWADAPIVLDREANDTSPQAQSIRLPAVVCGRFDRPGDADWYEFRAKAGESYAFDLLCERLGLPGDPFVIVTDAKGTELATFDDHGINVKALAQFNRDPVGTFRVPTEGTYRFVVRERYRHGGARYQYVLRLTKATPDFFPVVVHETPSTPTCPCVRQGGSAFVDLCLNRRDYGGPVTVEADGLPPGVTCRPVHVSPQSQTATVVFTAATDAPVWAGPVRLRAWAVVGGQRIERPVRVAQRRWAIDNINTSVEVRQLCLAVRPTAPYAIRFPETKQTVAAGNTLTAPAAVVRLWPDFRGKVRLNGLDLPPGFGIAAVDVPEGQNEAAIKITVAANVPPGDYTLVLRGDAQVPFQRDPKAAGRPLVRVADPSTPLTVRVTAAAKK